MTKNAKGLAHTWARPFTGCCSVVWQGQAGARPETPVMDCTRRVCREDAGRLLGLTEPPQEFRQAFRLRRQRLDLFLQRQDAPDPLQVDSLVLAQVLDVASL